MKVIRRRKTRKNRRTPHTPPLTYTITPEKTYTKVHFTSMGSPCEIIVDTTDKKVVKRLAAIATSEAGRIERKFSRYQKGNIVYDINGSNGRTVFVDKETERLLNFAKECFEISEGLFDITSGIFRKAWDFSKGADLPDGKELERLLSFVGWQKVRWEPPEITLHPGMEIDFGGVCKEYAVDSTALLFKAETDVSSLINYGGDIYSTGTRADGTPWNVGITPVHMEAVFTKMVQVKQSAVATSGDMFRSIEKGGKRYSHIINPETGWPVEGAPRAVTVLDNRCIDAGILATLALLQGREAETFLKHQNVVFWCQR